MWMLDVFCCALGCVTMLWLLNTRLAGDEKARAATALQDLTATRQTLLSTRDSADVTSKILNAEIERLKLSLAAVAADKDNLTKEKTSALDDLAQLRNTLMAEGRKTQKLMDDFQKQVNESEMLETKLATAVKSQAELDKLLRTREAESTALLARTKNADEKLQDLDAKYSAILKDTTAAAAVMKRSGNELSNAKVTIKDLQKKIDDTNATIVDLQGDKAKLADKVDLLRIESDARFAGIAMTGRRIVFLVDMSGSMKLIDDKTPAPTKWATVVDTLAKVMRSQPQLEKFQIIVFSKTAKPLFETRDWVTYQGEATLKSVREKMLAIEPSGDTNLYEAFDLAFRMKPEGLDTIYLFSDGLPTGGPGLEAEKNLTESQRNDLLTRQLKTALRTRWNPAGGRRVKINSIGFFFESPEVGAFLWSLSRDNDGSFVGMSRP